MSKKVSMLVNAKDVLGHIHPEVYGHFSEHLGRCIYEGIYVGEDSSIPNVEGMRTDVIEAFKEIGVPVLRWPGGCFADEYHWKDGVGPKENRKTIINTNWGGVTENNHFGTHEFMRFCELVGCKPYITGNLGSGTVQEMSEWVEYMTSDASSPMTELRKENGQEKPWKLSYFGVGNENWGCGGNMKASRYTDEYRRYQSYCKNHGDNQLFKIACGPSGPDYDWMETLMKDLGSYMVQGVDLHYYNVYDWAHKGSATEFTEEEYYKILHSAYFMEELLTRHSEIMNRYDPNHEIGLVVGEWGNWFEVEEGTNPGFLYQQNTMRDAIVAGMELNIFNRHSKRVVMANLAQVVNVLQSVVLTDGEQMIKTPTYHVFELYKAHQDADAVYCHADLSNLEDSKRPEDETVPAITSSASVKDGRLTITLTNHSLSDALEMNISLAGLNATKASAKMLTGDAHDYNDYQTPNKVELVDCDVNLVDGEVTVCLPPCSVVAITVE